MKKIIVIVSIFLIFPYICLSQQVQKRTPTIDELLSLKSLGSTAISPDGKYVAYSVRETDWKHNRYISQIWIAEIETGENFQLTRGKNSAGSFRWSPDGKWLAFLTQRDMPAEGTAPGEKKNGKIASTQIWLISPRGGEAFPLTKCERSIISFRWSPNGKKIAYTTSQPQSKKMKNRKEKYSDFKIVEKDYTMNELWVIDINTGKTKKLISEKDKNINQFSWSPDGSKFALTIVTDPTPKGFETADIYIFNQVDSSLEKLVSYKGPDSSPVWSPDGYYIAFNSSMGRNDFYYCNTEICIVRVDGGKVEKLTGDFDENAYIMSWEEKGIYFTALQRTYYHLFLLNPLTKKIKRITESYEFFGYSYSLSKDLNLMTFVSADAEHIGEVCYSMVDNFQPHRLTDMNDQIKDFTLGKRELIRWVSKDGTEIEGVLYKPADFDPGKKYPLLVIIHGGPTGINRALLDPQQRYYPIEQWLAKGAVILRPNYRGSAGYGEKFRSLNVRNLGVGDAWDVISGVDYLISLGFVDESRVGAMGWSQGGYISAFLATNSNRFKAISVGAGISDWMTYYVNTDITPFTIQYLKANPWDDPEIYAKTSPITNIKNATTPTLIQHGEFDKRVPIPNGFELYRGLKDQNVPVKMIVYKGFGHGITKPKSNRAVLQHNWEWFNKWIWGEE
ncbi:S9 family peptidase [candidate division KSB1 bacterium]|nr:MAG: S9 family peptidase [candidate division KSB1 bacterium]